MDVEKEIEGLKKTLADYQQTFRDIEKGVKDLKVQNRSEIAQKEKELEN